MTVKYELPDLSYDYAALEPRISAQIMELHHSKHHQTYVNGVNTALEQQAEARDKGDFAAAAKASKDLSFNLGGHVNHSIFWNNMSPDGGDKPVGELAAAIDDAFGSFDKFREQFTTAATTIQGSGWAVLYYDALGGNLLIGQPKDQQSDIQLGGVPVLQLDMWEHAFYLDYQNVKPDYVKAWWNVVNWEDAGARFERARQQTKGMLLG